MSVNIEIRRKQLENLQQFIGNARKKLHTVLDFFEWTEDKVKQGENALCALNPDHRVPAGRLEAHHVKCKLKSLNYDPQEPFLSEPLHDPKSSVYISKEKKSELLSKAAQSRPDFRKGRWNGRDDPRTADRLTSTFTSDERLVLYDHARSVTTGPEKPAEFNVTDNKPTDKELTYEEVLEQERNAKRRRIKYKAVHTSKKNHTEVLRDVIANQMELYEDWMAEKCGVKKEKHEERGEVVDSKKMIDEREKSVSESKEVRKNVDYDDRKRERKRCRSRERSKRSPSPYRSYKRYKLDDRTRRYK